MQYANQEVSLEEAIDVLQDSFLRGDYTGFNWIGGAAEAALWQRSRIIADADAMRRRGVDPTLIDYGVAAAMTPLYAPPTRLDADLFSMHFSTHDGRKRRNDAGLSADVIKLYFDADEIAAMSRVEADATRRGIEAVLTELRSLLDVEPHETPWYGAEVDVEAADRLRSDLLGDSKKSES